MQDLAWRLLIALALLVFVLFLFARNYLRMTTYRKDLEKDFYGTDSAMPFCVLLDIEENFLCGSFGDEGEKWEVWGKWEGKRWFMATHLYDVLRFGSWRKGAAKPGLVEHAIFLAMFFVAALIALRSIVSPKPDSLRTLVGLDAIMARRLLRKARKRLAPARLPADS